LAEAVAASEEDRVVDHEAVLAVEADAVASIDAVPASI
jgi:hypothetical protein